MRSSNFWEAIPVGQKNLPSGKVSGWPSDHLWLKVDASRFASQANWTSTEDSFPDLGDVEHCAADSNGKYSIPSTSYTQFLPNCPVIAACHLTSWSSEKGFGDENGAFWRTRTIFLAPMIWSKWPPPIRGEGFRSPTTSAQEYYELSEEQKVAIVQICMHNIAGYYDGNKSRYWENCADIIEETLDKRISVESITKPICRNRMKQLKEEEGETDAYYCRAAGIGAAGWKEKLLLELPDGSGLAQERLYYRTCVPAVEMSSMGLC